jgi:isochorismate synthase
MGPWRGVAAWPSDCALAVAPGCLWARRQSASCGGGATGVEADALAGSMPRGSGWEAQAAALRTSEKDLREHAPVRDAVVSALDPLCTAVTHPAVPTVRVLPTVLHLYSRVTGTLRDTTAGDVLALTDALHPTPAVCGTPREAARAFIAAHEDAPRGWYAGPVGWVDAAGEGEAMVALRSAVVCGATAWAYAGAGLVRGSDAAQEWRETDAKLGPMRAALGAGAA